jgi:hypothetical protein
MPDASRRSPQNCVIQCNNITINQNEPVDKWSHLKEENTKACDKNHMYFGES